MSCAARAPIPTGCSSSRYQTPIRGRSGSASRHRHALHVDEIDVLVRSTESPLALPGGDAPPTDADKAIAEHTVDIIPSGATLQTGIGSIPNQIATLLAEGDGGDYGLHSEMFTDGCMRLHRAGKITNTGKGQYAGVSVTTFAFGSPELYEWLDGNESVAFLPVEIVNSPDVIGANNDMISINGALAIDIHGQVVADTIGGDQFSGIGGAEDFVAGAGLELSDRSLICLPSTFEKDGELQSRIVPWFGPGAVITTPRHQVDVIVTEYGVAELEGKTVKERGEALAAIAHPQFRDELLAAAGRAAKGRSPVAVTAPSASVRVCTRHAAELRTKEVARGGARGGRSTAAAAAWLGRTARASRRCSTPASQGIRRSGPARARRRSRRA